MNVLNKAFTLLFLLIFPNTFIISQETIVIGQIYDEIDHAPLENVNIYFKKTDVGTSTNAEGFFMIRTTEKHGKLVVSAVGYHQEEFKVEQGRHASLDLGLREKNTTLQDVMVLPGVNPALEIMKNVRNLRKQNNIKNNEKIITHTQENTHLFLSDINARTLERRLFKDLKSGVISTQDSTLLLPLYRSSNEYTLIGKQKNLQKSDSLDVSIISKEDFTILLNGIETNIDFYQNSMILFERSFVSPLASNGNAFYQYFLTDSTTKNRGKQYQINFRPKNIHNPTFSGTMFVDSTTYALQSISANVPGKNNLNFVKSLQINQSFSEGLGNEFTLENENISLLFDYPLARKKDATRIFPTVYVNRNSIAKNSKIQKSSSEPHNNISDSAIVHSLTSTTNTPLIKTAKYVANAILTGYAPLGYIDIGNISNIIAMNRMEFLRLGIPLRTSEKLMKHANIEGFGAYGFRDKEWKYMGQIQAKLPTKKRHVFGLRYEDNYARTEVSDFDVLVHENGIGKGNMDFLSALLWFSNTQLTYARKREARLSIENEWTDNFETKLNARVGWMNYGNPTDTMYARPYRDLPNFRYNKLSLIGRFSWNERVVDKYFKRIHVYNNLPTLFLGAEAGNYRIKPSDNYKYYGKLQLMLRQKIALGIAGTLDYTLQGGYIFGDVPYPFLQIMHSNESYGSDRYRFNLLNNYEFGADKYIMLHTSWNAGGLLFNQIPVVNRWGLRERIGLKVAYGGLRDGHKNILALPEGMNTFTKPYAEVSAGIGNIFGLLGVDFMWRLSYRNVVNAQKWGVKFRLELGM